MSVATTCKVWTHIYIIAAAVAAAAAAAAVATAAAGTCTFLNVQGTLDPETGAMTLIFQAQFLSQVGGPR